MPGPWIHLGDNQEYFESMTLQKGEYLERTLYDDSHAEQGKGLWRVHKEEEKRSTGQWIQANLVAVSDDHLHWWMSGPGAKQKGQFLLHLCVVQERDCGKTKRKKHSEFHTHYFRTLSMKDVMDRKVDWFKKKPAQDAVEKEGSKLAGKNPPVGAEASGSKPKKGKDRAPDLQWSEEEEEPPAEVEDEAPDESGIRAKLRELKEELKAANSELKAEQAAATKKGKRPGPAGQKDAKKKKVGSGQKDRGTERPDPLWFGRRRHEESSPEPSG